MVDLNGDGALDLVINNNDSAPTIYRNRLVGEGHWFGLDLRSRTGSGEVLGARVRLTAGGRTMTRVVEAGSGYASQSPYFLHFGLGSADRIDRIEVTWPDDTMEWVENSEVLSNIDRRLQLTEGQLTQIQAQKGI